MTKRLRGRSLTFLNVYFHKRGIKAAKPLVNACPQGDCWIVQQPSLNGIDIMGSITSHFMYEGPLFGVVDM